MLKQTQRGERAQGLWKLIFFCNPGWNQRHYLTLENSAVFTAVPWCYTYGSTQIWEEWGWRNRWAERVVESRFYKSSDRMESKGLLCSGKWRHVEHLGQVRIYLLTVAEYFVHCESSREPCGFYRGTVIRAETGLGLENGCITSPVVLETGDSQHFNQLNEKVKVFSLFIVKKM